MKKASFFLFALQFFYSPISHAWDDKDTGLVVGSVLGGPIGLGVAAIYNNNSSNNSTALSFACLSIDGAPISNDTPLAEKCCSSGSLKSPTPSECRVGFFGTGPKAVGDGLGAFAVAQNLLQNASVMAGVSSDLQSDPSNPSGSNAPGSQSSALISSGEVGKGSDSDLGALAGLGSNSAGGAGGGGAGGGMGNVAAGSLGAAGGISESGVGKGKRSGTGTEDANFIGGAYASKGGAQDRAALASGGPDKVTPNDGSVELLDVNGQGAGGAGGAGLGAGGLNGGSGDLLSGSREDAADYLNRIDRNLSIFKVVSKRYEREISRSRVQAVEIK